MCPVAFTHKGGGGGGANSSICTEIELSAHFLYA